MIVNARMYSATQQAKAAWRRMLAWTLERARLDWQLIDYDAPAPLSELWARNDLGCTVMCGLPYSQRRPRPTLIAAPVPSPPRYAGRPIYFTDIVVRSDAPYTSLEDTFGGVVGYTLEDSMSGCVALRAYLLSYRQKFGPKLYREAVGGLINPRRVIDALAERRIDVGPLDSYYFDLLKHNEPEFAARVRVVASTVAAPIPPVVATSEIPSETLERLRAALLAVGKTPELAREREVLLLREMVVPDEGDYRALDDILAHASEYLGLW
jgi:ABC-type phosphate/phosphonate transport system substrate-binding protein